MKASELNNKGLAFYKLEKYQEALEAFERVTEIDPEAIDENF